MGHLMCLLLLLSACEVGTESKNRANKRVLPTSHGITPRERKYYVKDKINSLEHVNDYMRKHVYVFRNDKQKQDKSKLPFFSISDEQKKKLQAIGELDRWEDVAMDDHGMNYPELWELRPDKKVTHQEIFDEIISSGAYKTRLDKTHLLVSDRDQSKMVARKAWNYRSRLISPHYNEDTGRTAWVIESFHPNFEWSFVKWNLLGLLTLHGETYYHHPDGSVALNEGGFYLPWDFPHGLEYLATDGGYVYGQDISSTSAFKDLSFMDAIDVAINWIGHFEAAYGIEQK